MNFYWPFGYVRIRLETPPQLLPNFLPPLVVKLHSLPYKIPQVRCSSHLRNDDALGTSPFTLPAIGLNRVLRTAEAGAPGEIAHDNCFVEKFHLFLGVVFVGMDGEGTLSLPKRPFLAYGLLSAFSVFRTGHGKEKPRGAMPGNVIGSLAWFWSSPKSAFTALISDVEAIA